MGNRFAPTNGAGGKTTFVVCTAKTDAVLYLNSVFFIYKPKSKIALIISARAMSDKERKAYGRK